MSTTTTHLGLVKPELTDTADITQMNPNWDVIDEKLSKAYSAENKPSALDVGAAPSNHGHNANDIQGLADIAKTGSYNDLKDIPEIPEGITVDSALSSTSTNPVQNKVVKTELDKKAPSTHKHTKSDITDLGDLAVTRAVRFVIGTTTNGWTEADCDYLCDGTSDNVEINSAITALWSTGGEIVLLDGNYKLSAPIKLNKSNTTLRGSGAKLTRAFTGTSSNCGLILMSADNCAVRDLYLDGVKGTYSASDYNYGIYITGNNNTVENNFITSNGHCGIVTVSGEYHIVKGNHSNNNGTYGIYLSSDHCTAIGNTCNGNNRGITTWGDGNVISGNICRQNSESNIHLYSSNHNIVTDNNCIVLSADTTKPTNAIRIQDSASKNNIVTYNQVGNGTISNLYGGNIVGSPGYTYGTTDLTAGSSELATGQLYFVYE